MNQSVTNLIEPNHGLALKKLKKVVSKTHPLTCVPRLHSNNLDSK